ncbi:MAG: hypothetical protein Q9221_001886 [Calogaya cf. arnoldii]
MGADPNIEDHSGRSPKQLAWERILGGSPVHTLEALQSLRSMFKDFDATEDMDLPILHQIVLGLTPGNLEDELRKPITQINAQDRLGYTALTWAAQRNDIHALRLLLQYRVNPEMPDFQHCTPLRHNTFASLGDYQEPEAMKMLLHSRVDTLPDPKHGVSALHDAAYHHNDLRFIRPLVEAGCAVDHREWGTHAGAQTARQSGHLEGQGTSRQPMLIEHGANVSNIDKRGDTVVSTAVQNGSKKGLAIAFATWNGLCDALMTRDTQYCILRRIIVPWISIRSTFCEKPN